jgi:hypothetical protein
LSSQLVTAFRDSIEVLLPDNFRLTDLYTSNSKKWVLTEVLEGKILASTYPTNLPWWCATSFFKKGVGESIGLCITKGTICFATMLPSDITLEVISRVSLRVRDNVVHYAGAKPPK